MTLLEYSNSSFEPIQKVVSRFRRGFAWSSKLFSLRSQRKASFCFLELETVAKHCKNSCAYQMQMLNCFAIISVLLIFVLCSIHLRLKCCNMFSISKILHFYSFESDLLIETIYIVHYADQSFTI